MNTIQLIQQSKFSSYYCDNTIKQLNNIKEALNNIEKAYKELDAYIKDEIFKSDIYTFFTKEVNEYIKWINKIKNETNKDKIYISKENFNNRIKEAFDEYIETYKNEFLEKINKSLEDLKKTFDDIIDYSFDPPKVNNSSDELINLKLSDSNIWENLGKTDNNLSNYSTFYDNFNISINNEEKNNESFNCNSCTKKNASYYCKHCNNFFCEECYNKCKDYEKLTNHEFINMDDTKKENEHNKNIFLQSFINLFKDYIYKCNYILKNEKQNYVDPNTFKAFQYPVIHNENSLNNQISFLKEINDTYDKIENDIDDKINKEEISDRLITSLENIFGEKKIHLNYNLEDIDNSFYSDE